MPYDNVVLFPRPCRSRAPRAAHVWIVDDKPHIRSFLSALLGDLGCVVHADPDLTRGGALPVPPADAAAVTLIGVSRNIATVATLLQQFAAAGYRGKVLLMGGRHSLALHVTAALGANCGLSLLPVLGTPFRTADLEHRIAIAHLPDAAQDVAEAEAGQTGPRLIRLAAAAGAPLPPSQPLPTL